MYEMYERMSQEMFTKLENMFWAIANSEWATDTMSVKEVAEFVCRGYNLHFIKSVDKRGDLYESTFEGFVYVNDDGFDYMV